MMPGDRGHSAGEEAGDACQHAISFLRQTFYRASKLMVGTADVLGGRGRPHHAGVFPHGRGQLIKIRYQK